MALFSVRDVQKLSKCPVPDKSQHKLVWCFLLFEFWSIWCKFCQTTINALAEKHLIWTEIETVHRPFVVQLTTFLVIHRQCVVAMLPNSRSTISLSFETLLYSMQGLIRIRLGYNFNVGWQVDLTKNNANISATRRGSPLSRVW